MSFKPANYTYYAFISYRRTDSRWAHWLQQNLQAYRLPSKLCKAHAHLSKRLTPVFLDKTDLGPGMLSDSLREQAAASKYLIVVCSRAVAEKPEYIDAEIRYFLESGHDASQIIPFIIDDCEKPEEECFPPLLKELNQTHGILGVNIHESGMRRAFLKVVARMHGLKVTELESAEDRRKRRNGLIAAFCALAATAALAFGAWTWWDLNVPKVASYLDYTTVYGIPKGIGELTEEETSRTTRHYQLTWYKGEDRYELRHQNSAGVLIAHTDTEHQDRPTMAVYECNNGRLTQTTHYDIHEQPVLTMKYDQSLRTVDLLKAAENSGGYSRNAFMSAATTAITADDASATNSSSIMRYLIDYDANGYIEQMRYASNGNNAAACDANGIWGLQYTRDEAGRPVKMEYLTFSGARNANAENRDEYSVAGDAHGVAGRSYAYDNNKLVLCTYFDVNGQPTLNELNFMIGRSIYDEHYNCIREEYLDADGNLLPTIYLFAANECTYTAEGFVERIRYYDHQGRPALSSELLAEVHRTYDARGNVLSQTCYDAHGQLTICADGYAVLKMTYDSNNNQTSYATYGIDGQPCMDADGIYGYRGEYDGLNQITRLTFIDPDGNPMMSPWGYAMYTCEYEDGQQTSCHYLDVNGNSVTSADGVASVYYGYDEWGNRSRYTFTNTQSEPCLSSYGYAAQELIYNQQGQLVASWYLGLDDQPVLITEGYAGYENQYDSQGRLIKEIYYGPDREIMVTEYGYAIRRFTYDAFGRETSRTYCDANDQPMYHSDGNAGILYEYDARGNVTKCTYVNTEGQPTMTSMGYASVVYEYDEQGNRIRRSYYDAQGLPTICADGFAEWLSEYDERGNTTCEYYLDTEGNPILNESGVYKGIALYDERNNKIRLTCYTADDVLTKCLDNWAYCEYTYDAYGNELSRAYFDTEGQPVISGAGYARREQSYDVYGNVTRAAYYNAAGELTEIGGYAITLNTYDSLGRLIEVQYLNAEEKRSMTDDGYSRLTYVRDAMGNVLERRQYDANDQLVDTEEHPAIEITAYNSYQQQIYGECRDASGELTTQPYGYAFVESTFDAYGNRTSRSYFDELHEPLYYSKVYEYDEYHRMIRELHYNTEGQLVCNEDGYAIIEITYDDHGRVLRQAYFDEAHEPALYMGNYHSYSCQYDARGNQTHLEYLAPDGSLTPRSPGEYAACITKYDDMNRGYLTAFYGADGMLMLYKGYAYEKKFYNDQNLVYQYAYYDLDGNLTNTDQGYAKFIILYDDLNQMYAVGYFDQDGEYLGGRYLNQD